jgi:hypothetical protein
VTHQEQAPVVLSQSSQGSISGDNATVPNTTATTPVRIPVVSTITLIDRPASTRTVTITDAPAYSTQRTVVDQAAYEQAIQRPIYDVECDDNGHCHRYIDDWETIYVHHDAVTHAETVNIAAVTHEETATIPAVTHTETLRSDAIVGSDPGTTGGDDALSQFGMLLGLTALAGAGRFASKADALRATVAEWGAAGQPVPTAIEPMIRSGLTDAAAEDALTVLKPQTDPEAALRQFRRETLAQNVKNGKLAEEMSIAARTEGNVDFGRRIGFRGAEGSGRTVVDAAVLPDGKIQLVESKWRDAPYTQRQSEIYPQIESGEAIPVGENAADLKLKIGEPLKNSSGGMKIVTDRWYGEDNVTFRTPEGLVVRVEDGKVVSSGAAAEAAAAEDAARAAAEAAVAEDAARAAAAAEDATKVSEGFARGAARAAKALEVFGKVMLPVAVAADVYLLAQAVRADGGFGRNTAKTAGSIAGGWGGFFAGAAAGAAIGVVGGPVGMIVGGIIGGIIGSMAGSAAGEAIADAAYTAVTQPAAVQALVDKANQAGFHVDAPGEPSGYTPSDDQATDQYDWSDSFVTAPSTTTHEDDATHDAVAEPASVEPTPAEPPPVVEFTPSAQPHAFVEPASVELTPAEPPPVVEFTPSAQPEYAVYDQTPASAAADTASTSVPIPVPRLPTAPVSNGAHRRPTTASSWRPKA